MNAQELKELRNKLGLTQKEMAPLLGLNLRMYSYIETGERELSKAGELLAERLNMEK